MTKWSSKKKRPRCCKGWERAKDRQLKGGQQSIDRWLSWSLKKPRLPKKFKSRSGRLERKSKNKGANWEIPHLNWTPSSNKLITWKCSWIRRRSRRTRMHWSNKWRRASPPKRTDLKMLRLREVLPRTSSTKKNWWNFAKWRTWRGSTETCTPNWETVGRRWPTRNRPSIQTSNVWWASLKNGTLTPLRKRALEFQLLKEWAQPEEQWSTASKLVEPTVPKSWLEIPRWTKTRMWRMARSAKASTLTTTRSLIFVRVKMC